MAAAPKKIIPSVDYTSRDYAALRQELITRVQDRVPAWTGNDPADFGLALVESFAYMGDLVNYYIDRIANESYLLTATQRQSVLNLAASYGYYPKGYSSATTSITFNSNVGYRGQIGGSVIESKYAYLIVPNDHTFQVGQTVTVTGNPETSAVGGNASTSSTTITLAYSNASITIGQTVSGTGIAGSPVVSAYDGNVTVTLTTAQSIANGTTLYFTAGQYNGTFTVTGLTYSGSSLSVPSGSNVIQYLPQANISNFATATVGSGYTITYTYAFPYVDTYTVGQSIIVENVVMSSGGSGTVNGTFTVSSTGVDNSGNLTVTVSVATGTTPTKTYVSGGTISYANLVATSAAVGYVYETGNTLIPAGTQFYEDITYNGEVVEVYFSLNEDVSVPYQGSVTHVVYQGQNVAALAGNLADPNVTGDISGELVGTSNGTTNQYYVLSQPYVDNTSLNVYVSSGNYYVNWKQVDNLNDWSNTATVYTATTDEDGYTYIVFGDGVAGAIPPQDAKIKVAYFAGAGAFGNIPAGTNSGTGLNYYYFPTISSAAQTNIKTYISLSHPAATGGADPESSDSIRINAPRALRAMNRAVTLQDYIDLSTAVPGVAKANAVASIWSSVNVYVAPTADDYAVAPLPSTSLTNTVQSTLTSKSQIGATISVSSAIYNQVFAEITYSVEKNYDPASVQLALTSILTDVYSYKNNRFAQSILANDLEYICRNVSGVNTAKVTKLYRNGGSGINVLQGAANEIFVLNSTSLSYVIANSTATLSALSTTSSTGNNAVAGFAPNVYAYSISSPNGDSSITITPTATAASTTTISIQNQPVTSGTASIAIALVVGANLIPISVSAADGTTLTYYLTVNRAS